MLLETNTYTPRKLFTQFLKRSAISGALLGSLYGVAVFPLNTILTANSNNLDYSLRMGGTVGLLFGFILGSILGIVLGLIDGLLVAAFSGFLAGDGIADSKFGLIVQIVPVSVLIIILLALTLVSPHTLHSPKLSLYYIEIPWIITLLTTWYSSRRILRSLEQEYNLL